MASSIDPHRPLKNYGRNLAIRSCTRILCTDTRIKKNSNRKKKDQWFRLDAVVYDEEGVPVTAFIFDDSFHTNPHSEAKAMAESHAGPMVAMEFHNTGKTFPVYVFRRESVFLVKFSAGSEPRICESSRKWHQDHDPEGLGSLVDEIKEVVKTGNANPTFDTGKKK